jgi:hypothetical protein
LFVVVAVHAPMVRGGESYFQSIDNRCTPIFG